MTRARAIEITYAALRILAGLMFMMHGTQKLLGWPPPELGDLPLQIKIGGVIELAGGALIAVGLFTRIAAFVCSGQMAVAFFQFHVFDGKVTLPPLSHFLPITTGADDTVLYCFVFLAIAAAGAGRFSLDHKLRHVT